MQSERQQILVFHGTTRANANRILKEGFVMDKYCGAMRNYIADCIDAGLPNAHNQRSDLLRTLERLDSDHPILITNAIATFTQGKISNNFEYGELYVTTGFRRAYSYASKRPELQRAAAEIQRIMVSLNEQAAQKLRTTHIDLLNWAEEVSLPCVLGILINEEHHFQQENGMPASWDDLIMMRYQSDVGNTTEGCEVAHALRLTGASVDDICFTVDFDFEGFPENIKELVFRLPAEPLMQSLMKTPFWRHQDEHRNQV